jgi:hypothetical protein
MPIGQTTTVNGAMRVGPDDAALVVVLLDGGGRQARDADAVAAHLEGLRLAVFVEEGGVHALLYLVPR